MKSNFKRNPEQCLTNEMDLPPLDTMSPTPCVTNMEVEYFVLLNLLVTALSITALLKESSRVKGASDLTSDITSVRLLPESIAGDAARGISPGDPGESSSRCGRTTLSCCGRVCGRVRRSLRVRSLLMLSLKEATLSSSLTLSKSGHFAAGRGEEKGLRMFAAGGS